MAFMYEQVGSLLLRRGAQDFLEVTYAWRWWEGLWLSLNVRCGLLGPSAGFLCRPTVLAPSKPLVPDPHCGPAAPSHVAPGRQLRWQAFLRLCPKHCDHCSFSFSNPTQDLPLLLYTTVCPRARLDVLRCSGCSLETAGQSCQMEGFCSEDRRGKWRAGAPTGRRHPRPQHALPAPRASGQGGSTPRGDGFGPQLTQTLEVWAAKPDVLAERPSHTSRGGVCTQCSAGHHRGPDSAGTTGPAGRQALEEP